MNLLLALVPYRQSPVSVPLRGSGLMNNLCVPLQVKSCKCFRPLAGKWINELLVHFLVYLLRLHSFRPLAGKWINELYCVVTLLPF